MPKSTRTNRIGPQRSSSRLLPWWAVVSLGVICVSVGAARFAGTPVGVDSCG